MNLTEMKAVIEKLQASQAASDAKITALETSLAAVASENTALKADVQTRLDAIGSAVTASCDAVKVSTEDMIAKLKVSSEALEAKIKSSDAKAIEIAASAGVPPVPEKTGNPEEKTKTNLKGARLIAHAINSKFSK